MASPSNAKFEPAAMCKDVNPSPPSTAFSREVPPPSVLNINITTPTPPAIQDAMSTPNLESRIAAVETSLAGINETVAKVLHTQGQNGYRDDNSIPKDKAFKDIVARVNSIAGDFGKLKKVWRGL